MQRSQVRAALSKTWAGEEMACLDALDEAVASAFVEHAAKLQGLNEAGEAGFVCI
jgi:hypothetical protein